MAAFRFLALFSTGFALLVFCFLQHASLGRSELEARRRVRGPELVLAPGQEVTWTVELGAARGDDAWPAAQRQPRLVLEGSRGTDARCEAEATYLLPEGPRAAFVSGAGPLQSRPEPRRRREVRAASDPFEGELGFGPLWLNWEHPLEVRVRVLEGESGATVRPVLAGRVSDDFVAARVIARTLWTVFTVIGAASFAVLIATLRGTWPSARPGGEGEPTAPAA
ncbi:MAG: hypothetical protein AAFZ87_04420 [Planctomycetota bacterium]